MAPLAANDLSEAVRKKVDRAQLALTRISNEWKGTG